MYTIYDVARYAGLSVATVSRVLSNRGYVSNSARERVTYAIEKLGYVPNAMARGLKTQRSGLIVLVVPEIVNSFFTTIARGVEDVANKNGFNVILNNSDEKIDKERNYIEVMISQQVDGVVIAPASRSAHHFQPLLDRAIPVVVIDRIVDNFPTDTVRGDNIGGAIELTKHLIRLGHRQIALVNGHPDTSTAQERALGFRLAMEESGLPVSEALISEGSWWIEDAERRIEALLAVGTDFSAVFATNNFMAIGTLLALRKRNIRVPEDVALVCFDDIEVASQIYPFLTVMAQPAYTIGVQATEFLLERLNGTYNGEPRDVVLSPRLILRQSCGGRK